MKRHPIQQLGAYLGLTGGALLAAIFVLVLVNGSWPAFLQPVQNLFGAISHWAGDFALIAEIWLFVGPGVLLYYWGKHLAEKREHRD
jgi:hypothetical protein